MAQKYQREDELNITDSCLCFLHPNTRVLEMGSATGYITRYMNTQLHCTVTCIELDPEMAQMATPYAEKVIVADLNQDRWTEQVEGEFDFIMFADVLEHLHNPQLTVARALPFLKKDGSVISSIPNIGHNAILLSLRNGIFNYTATGLLDNTHIHLMTRNSIESCFSANQLYCCDEVNKPMRPCDTELERYYIQNPLLALSVIFKPDAHVYRYVQRWQTTPCSTQTFRSKRFGLMRAAFELGYDALCYCKRKTNIETPKWITRFFFNPLINKENKRYDKYRTQN